MTPAEEALMPGKMITIGDDKQLWQIDAWEGEGEARKVHMTRLNGRARGGQVTMAFGRLRMLARL